jgi:hypothetical protein
VPPCVGKEDVLPYESPCSCDEFWMFTQSGSAEANRHCFQVWPKPARHLRLVSLTMRVAVYAPPHQPCAGRLLTSTNPPVSLVISGRASR